MEQTDIKRVRVHKYGTFWLFDLEYSDGTIILYLHDNELPQFVLDQVPPTAPIDSEGLSPWYEIDYGRPALVPPPSQTPAFEIREVTSPNVVAVGCALLFAMLTVASLATAVVAGLSNNLTVAVICSVAFFCLMGATLQLMERTK